MLIKVCGLRDSNNIKDISALSPDYMGFIFYPSSPRFAKSLDNIALQQISKNTKKVGVFVNENLENILTYIYKYKLDAVQLHGSENITLCEKIKKETSVEVIKAIAVMDKSNFWITQKYNHVVDKFLFDTKTDIYGGSGQKFDWSILDEYQGEKEFLLSGGISTNDIKNIRKISHPKMVGVDINSRFEQAPGIKDTSLVQKFIYEIKKQIPKTDPNSNE